VIIFALKKAFPVLSGFKFGRHGRSITHTPEGRGNYKIKKEERERKKEETKHNFGLVLRRQNYIQVSTVSISFFGCS